VNGQVKRMLAAAREALDRLDAALDEAPLGPEAARAVAAHLREVSVSVGGLAAGLAHGDDTTSLLPGCARPPRPPDTDRAGE
jgi:hypothetical protein